MKKLIIGTALIAVATCCAVLLFASKSNAQTRRNTPCTQQTIARLFTLKPAAADDDIIHAARAGTASNTWAGPFATPDVPRSLMLTCGAGWDGGNVTISGRNQFDEPITEVVTMTDAGGTTETYAIFKSVHQVKKVTVGVNAATCKLGTGDAIGIAEEMSDAGGIADTVDDGLLWIDGVLDADVLVDTEYMYWYGTADVPDGSVVFKFLTDIVECIP